MVKKTNKKDWARAKRANRVLKEVGISSNKKPLRGPKPKKK